MNRIYCILILSVLMHICTAQVSEKERQAILKEGIMLYHLELASWNASDLLDGIGGINTLDSIGGYVSYRMGSNYNTVYYGEKQSDRIYAHFIFDSLCSVMSATLDMTPRAAGKTETALITLREDSLQRIEKNDGNFFTKHPGIYFNLVPVIAGSEMKVFVFSAGGADDEIILGNDYVLAYQKDYKLLSRKKLHGELISLPMDSDAEYKQESITSHEHKGSSSPSITSTDICTLLLYEEYTSWNKHLVFSPQLVSIFDMENRKLEVITRKAFEDKKK